jgi:hypothetical protein
MAEANVLEHKKTILDRYVNQTSPRHEPEVEDAIRDTHQPGRVGSSVSIMLDLKMADGSIESFDYAYLMRATFQPGDRIILRFGKPRVIIEGRHLHALRDALTERRARFVHEGTDTELGLKPEDEPHIDRIYIEEGEEE